MGFVLLALAGVPCTALAQPCMATDDSLESVYAGFNQPFFFDWQGSTQEADVCFPSRQSGAQLKAYLIAPANIETIPDGSLPVVVIGPGSVNGIALYYKWSARELAGHGYLALVTDPQGAGRSEILGACGPGGCAGVPFQSAANYVENLVSGMDYAFTREHPWLKKADLTRIGVAGHSLSARSAVFVGSTDPRVGAVVAWDNMAANLHGDEGTPSGEGACASLIGGELPGASAPIVPRVPTMGQASDVNGTCNFEKNTVNLLGNDPELKKAGYRKWKEAGIPSMQLAFTGSAHGDWAQQRGSNAQGAARIERQLEVFQYYTRAWFDLYLKRDESARKRLLARTLALSSAEVSIEDDVAQMGGLSRKFRSAVFMPEAGLTKCEALIATTASLPPNEDTKSDCVLRSFISGLLPLTLLEDAPVTPVNFTIVMPADSLNVTARSDNPLLLPDNALALSGGGANRTLQLKPLANQSGTSNITVTVSDGVQSASATFPLNVRPVNDSPLITSTPELSVQAGKVYSYQLTVSDPDDAAGELTYALLNAPSGMRVSDRGLIDWMPSTEISGAVPVRVQARDGGEDSARPAQQDFILQVGQTPALPPAAGDGESVVPRGGSFEWSLSMLALIGWILRRRKPLTMALTVFGGLLAPMPAAYAAVCEETNVSPGVPADQALGRQESFDWQGEFVEDDGICFPSRQSGAQLRAFLLAPANIETIPDGSLPVVVIGPGSGGAARAMNYLWSARDLAGHGYLALSVDPQGVGRSEVNGGEPGGCGAGGCPNAPFQKAGNFVDGLASGTDYLFTREHPWLKKADLTRIGVAGHSLSARAATYLGGMDERFSAAVGWDNMSSDLNGDAGISSGGGACGSAIGGEPPSAPVIAPPRIPTMGQASDVPGGCTQDSNPEVKKTGYEHWRAAGTPTLQMVFKEAAHGDWAHTSSSVSEQLQLFEHYTRAWFDLYLHKDESARQRLLMPQVAAFTPEQIYSVKFRSAAFMPEAGVDCPDLLGESCSARTAPASATSTGAASSGGLLLGAWSLWPGLLLMLAGVLRSRVQVRA